jgi:type IV pilus assembly protein PilW
MILNNFYKQPNPLQRKLQKQAGFTLVEAMISMALGLFLILGAVTIYSQGSRSFQTTEGTSRVQENLRFAFATIEPDVRLAGFWGMHNGSGNIEEDAIVITCDGANVTTWALDHYVGVTARDNIQAAASGNVAANARVVANCPAFDLGVQEGSDILEIRRSSAGETPLTVNTVQIKSDRYTSHIFVDGNEPAGFKNLVDIDGTFDYEFSTYYVAQTSNNIADTPSLRKRTLIGTQMVDEEIIAGVENMQIQFGLDTNGDGSVNGYIDPVAGSFTADSTIIAVRVWLLIRAEYEELGLVDGKDYTAPDGTLITPADAFRRIEGAKTIFLRNSRG